MVKQKLDESIKAAMRSHEKPRLMVLRTLKSAVKQVEIDSREELSEERVLEILQGQLKQREQARDLYLQGERKELADQESFEINIIQEFLPKPLTNEELESAVQEAIEELSASDMSAMGKVMKHLKEELGSQADGKRLSALVRNHLGNN